MGASTHQAHKNNWFYKIRTRRFQSLLVLLLTGLVISPIVGQYTYGKIFASVISVLSFLQICVSIVHKREILLIAGVTAFLAALYSSLVTMDLPYLSNVYFQASSRIISLFFIGTAVFIIFKDVIRAGPVDMNKLYGSVCLYILLGFLWGQIYQLCTVVDPLAFRFDPSLLGADKKLCTFEESILMNYFSFVTLSTLGYGDVQPVSIVTRTLAYCEALTGQIYLALLVSRLVGLHIAASAAPSNSDD